MFYSTVCHQNPDKSFFYNGLQLLVCARCFGIYCGALLSAFIILLNDLKIPIKFLFFSLTLIATDILFYQLNFYSYNKIISMTTGIVFGTTVFHIIFESIKETVLKHRDEKNSSDNRNWF